MKWRVLNVETIVYSLIHIHYITVAILITQDQTKIYFGLLKYKQIT